jgi:predicted DNA-binding transcriptional regulator YafY
VRVEPVTQMTVICQHMRRKSRLFAVAEALRARRTGVTAEELARRFGVTIRTIYRDLDALAASGLPLRAERGRGGGYALDKSYQLPPVNFTAREAALLVLLAQMAVEQRLLPFVETLNAARDKVRGALSVSGQRELMDHLRTVSTVGVPAAPVSAAVQRVLEAAWFEQRSMWIQYRKPDGRVQRRTVRVRSIVCDRSATLLNCIDLESGEDRQFRLDRIAKAGLLETI